MAHSEAPGVRGGHSRAAEGGNRPGSEGEHRLQEQLGTTARADRFYDEQVLDHLNERMCEFTERQEMFFLATADQHGECDNSFRAGPAGFLRVLDSRTLVFPEYRGNGVHASLGNIRENPHLGILMVDFVRARIGLHINGNAEIVEDEEMRTWHPDLPVDPIPGRRAQLWVLVGVEEAYIHCAKHIPHLQKAPKRSTRDWGTDDYKRKGGDFFGAARDARERGPSEHPSGGEESAAPAPQYGAVPPVSVPGQASEASEGGRASEASEGGRVREVHQEERVGPEGQVNQAGHAGLRELDALDSHADWATMGLTTVSPAGRTAGESTSPAEPPATGLPERTTGSQEWTPWAPTPAGPATPAEPSSAGSSSLGDPASYSAHPRNFDQEVWREEAARALAEAERRAQENARRDPIPFQGWFS
ncbi:pyridoxamine 5'-phosphate oxidase family protein [Streptomyces oceani]|uniref:pyridoxamine 5'-phosphate oxidase family protein n=1 Tax=Streptomyces oceani TaxID=1075402 RepID=UPI0009A1127D